MTVSNTFTVEIFQDPGGPPPTTFALSWDVPTVNSDGTTIPSSGPNALLKYRVEYGTAANGLFGQFLNSVIVAHPTTSVAIAVPGPGTYAARVISITNDGDESMPSAVIFKTV